MKKLKKLQINSKKLMKNEDLITLKGGGGEGGYGGVCCWCFDQNMDPITAMASLNADDCMDSCYLIGGLGYYLC